MRRKRIFSAALIVLIYCFLGGSHAWGAAAQKKGSVGMNEKAWWKEGVVYQVYPRSFVDSDGDGIGDLAGILSKLDYLKELGVDIIWLNPVYCSPDDDNGYDISDYCGIMKQCGTMGDWERLRDGLHKRGMKLIMDLVVNHTSDEHRWFHESRSSKADARRDFYIWKPGRDGHEPNNWLSCFGGPAWELDRGTGEYYLHIFSKKQPDLNWESPAMRREIFSMMNWWLDRGIDGFRMDVINFISKDQDFPSVSAPPGEYRFGSPHYINGPRVHEFLREMNERVLSKRDIMTVGETPGATPDDAILFSDPARKELNMVFQFELMDIDSGSGGKWDPVPWKLVDFKRITSSWQEKLQGRGWNSLYLNNHDQPRMVSRFGDDGNYRIKSAKLLATYLHTLQGTPYIYQGEEIGMTNVKFDSIECYRDIEIRNLYDELVKKKKMDPERVLSLIHQKGRDNARTPMQWDDTPGAGFSRGTPWIPLNPNYRAINVKEARADNDSIFNYYKRLISLRKSHPIIVYGTYREILRDHDQIFAYLRCHEGKTLLVLLNFSDREALFEKPADVKPMDPKIIIANYPANNEPSLDRVTLRPYEAKVYLW
jgi:oligo-1,6-glucosidase